MVSVVMITYNHQQYIIQAIEGILMQKCSFDIELIIANDSSPDNTDIVIKDYLTQKTLPKNILIKYTKHEVNKGINPNFMWALKQASEKYIAICEGDDYWIDPLKLQKQVDFLEDNQEYGLVHADANFYYQLTGDWKFNVNKDKSNKNEATSKEELFNRIVDGDYVIRTATVMYRTKFLALIQPNNVEFLMGDTPLWLDLSQITKFKYIDEVFTTYRILQESASKSTNKKKLHRFRLSMIEMRIHYLEKYNYSISNKLKDRYNSLLLNYILLYDKEYISIYTLFNPTSFQKIRLKYNKIDFFRYSFKTTKKIEDYIKLVFRKFK